LKGSDPNPGAAPVELDTGPDHKDSCREENGRNPRTTIQKGGARNCFGPWQRCFGLLRIRRFDWWGHHGDRFRQLRLRRWRFYICYEPVTSAGDGFDIPWLIGRVPKGIPQPLYRSVDTVIEFNNRVVRP
jgi:hypothetical protein